MNSQILAIPRCDVSVREATLADVGFIDSLQKMHKEQLGFLRTSWIEGKIRAGQVLVAEETQSAKRITQSEENAGSPTVCAMRSEFCAPPLGYIISQDKYHKREELGLIVQLCVVPGAQRGFVGMTLLKAAFDRAAYGCRLFCCWCAQDIEANRFWEAMGFVPLAYRAGSEKKARVHIFWQRRIREGDTVTPWWYPTETTGGAIGEGRIVLPIPPGKRWSDELPVLLPAAPVEKQLPAPRKPKARAPVAPKRQPLTGGLCFAPPEFVATAIAVAAKKPQKTRPERSRRKNDPKLVAAARELRDRWLEHVNAGEMLLEGAGKYDVSRLLPSSPAPLLPSSPALLPAA